MSDLMPDDVVETASTNDDLRATINAALAKQREAAPVEVVATEPPAETAEETKADRARAPDGKFVEKPKEAAVAAEAPKAAPTPDATVEPAPATPEAKPPVGWSAAAKAKFATLDPDIKADIAKREVEINAGFAKLADFKDIEPFVRQATESGTTLKEALTKYTRAEDSLRKDPVRGVAEICRMAGFDPRLVASAILGIQPGAPGETPQPPAQGYVPPELLQELASVKGTLSQLQQFHQASERNALASKVDAFFSDPAHKHADAVSEIMTGLINQARTNGTPIDLDAIYGQAVWQHPDVREELIKERTAAAVPPPTPPNPIAKAAAAATQAKQAAKATTGAPARSTPAGAPPPTNLSIRDNIVAAIEAQRGV